MSGITPEVPVPNDWFVTNDPLILSDFDKTYDTIQTLLAEYMQCLLAQDPPQTPIEDLERKMRLSTLQLDDDKFRSSLIAQSKSALYTCPEDSNSPDQMHYSAYFTQPDSDGFLVADLTGAWEKDLRRFHLQSITVRDVFRSLEMVLDHLQSEKDLNAQIPQVASDAFVEALGPNKP